ncbi:hypothetical protein DB31_6380 [Hyalangium minutum]|uniref:Uncharacterized protein n=1 Tax=Hyalangium minutum TaxID=394096 RepID=A0A085WNZ2_9BACT|nr:hypothetical protein DB31_6380 [Hyalangium minutum]
MLHRNSLSMEMKSIIIINFSALLGGGRAPCQEEGLCGWRRVARGDRDQGRVATGGVRLYSARPHEAIEGRRGIHGGPAHPVVRASRTRLRAPSVALRSAALAQLRPR